METHVGLIAWLTGMVLTDATTYFVIGAQKGAHFGSGVQLRHLQGCIESLGAILRLQRQGRRPWMQAVEYA